MKQIGQVNEKSTAYLTVVCKDKAGVAQAPAALRYRIDDVYSGQPVRDDTPLTPAATVEIALTPEDNTLLNGFASSEGRRVTVTAEYGESDAVNSEFVYEVVNLAGVPQSA